MADTLSVLLTAKTLKLPKTKNWLHQEELKKPKKYCDIEKHEASHVSSNHEDLDTRIVLHALDATAVGIKELLANVMIQIRVSDGLIL